MCIEAQGYHFQHLALALLLLLHYLFTHIVRIYLFLLIWVHNS
jgi:hypothetical protein